MLKYLRAHCDTYLDVLKVFKDRLVLSFTDLRTENTRAILPMALILFLITSLRRLAAAPINIRDAYYDIRMTTEYQHLHHPVTINIAKGTRRAICVQRLTIIQRATSISN